METHPGFRLCVAAFQLPFLTAKPAKIVKDRETQGGKDNRDSFDNVASQLHALDTRYKVTCNKHVPVDNATRNESTNMSF